jgi:hypothetical protein
MARNRIERWYKAIAIMKTAITVLIVPVVFRDATRWWWALGLALPYLIQWRISNAAIEELNEIPHYRIHEADTERTKEPTHTKGTHRWDREYKPERWQSPQS